MQAIKCEMCNSNDFTKQDGMYICQHCGTKYTVEEAKKLMVEIDNSKKLANLYERARKSIEVNDLAHAAEYYKQILDEDPNDWEAYFYSYLGEFPTFTNAQAASVALKLGETIPSAYDMAIENCDHTEAESRIKTISEQTSTRILEIASTVYSLMSQYEGGGFGAAGSVHRNLYSNMRSIALNTIVDCVDSLNKLDSKVESIYNSETQIDKQVLVNSMLTIRRIRYSIADHQYRPSSFTTEKFIKQDFILKFAQAIKDLDPTFEMPVVEQPHEKEQRLEKERKKDVIRGVVILILGLLTEIITYSIHALRGGTVSNLMKYAAIPVIIGIILFIIGFGLIAVSKKK